MRTLQEWLTLYERDHQNPANKVIHWICIPAILFSTLGLLACIPLPWLDRFPALNAALILFYLPALVFYFRLNPALALVFLVTGGLMLLANGALQGLTGWPLFLYIHLAIFLTAWVLQLIGHKLEGQKPAFFEDLQFLLIGPAWMMARLTGLDRKQATNPNI